MQRLTGATIDRDIRWIENTVSIHATVKGRSLPMV